MLDCLFLNRNQFRRFRSLDHNYKISELLMTTSLGGIVLSKTILFSRKTCLCLRSNFYVLPRDGVRPKPERSCFLTSDLDFLLLTAATLRSRMKKKRHWESSQSSQYNFILHCLFASFCSSPIRFYIAGKNHIFLKVGFLFNNVQSYIRTLSSSFIKGAWQQYMAKKQEHIQSGVGFRRNKPSDRGNFDPLEGGCGGGERGAMIIIK